MIDRKRLLKDCQNLVEQLVDDLRERSDDDEEVRRFVRGEYSRAESAGRTQRAYEDWREDMLAQVAVGWVLASVFVRFVEDNALVDRPLLSGPGQRRDLARDHRASWLGDHAALGDREWLVEVFDRIAQLPGMGELLGDRNPLRMFGPSADGARAILDLWWRTEDGGSLTHDFTDPDWDTRFLGDLYQDLSEHAKKTYALLQTPEFVEEFLLDYTLDPAIETFGLDEVRMIDPTCGSGHLCLGSFDRLFRLWQEREPGTNARVLAQRALDAVNGVDINPFAAEVARFRLLVAALKACDIRRLADAPDFHINIAVGDSLLHGTAVQLTLTRDESDPLVRHRYPSEDGKLADELLQPGRYHAVVGNPPYITVKDKALSDAYRERYSACHRQYSLGVPFTQRFFRLAVKADDGAGYVGMITANSFMKREFGTKLVEEYLASEVDLTHIIDTSGAYIPGHGTPTVILYGRNRAPLGQEVRAVLGIRGEPGQPEAPRTGLVWTAISQQIEQPGSESEFISVEDAPRDRYREHPWSLQGGAAPELMGLLEGPRSRMRLDQVTSTIGIGGITGTDDAFVLDDLATVARFRLESTRSYITGSHVRDWMASGVPPVAWPYDKSFQEVLPSVYPNVVKFLWPNRTILRHRKRFGTPVYELNIPWYAWKELYHERLQTPLTIAYPFVSTHNHFVLDRGGSVFNRHAPVIKLPKDASEEDHLGLLGVLNSSVALFWMKQVVHKKTQMGGGGGSAEAPFTHQHEFDGTKLKELPLPEGRPVGRARTLDLLARELSSVVPTAVVRSQPPTSGVLASSRVRGEKHRARMVAVQEELDWECYWLYGLVEDDLTLASERVPDLVNGERAFEIVLARRLAAGEVESSWFDRHGLTPITDLPPHWPDEYRRLVERRIELIESHRTVGLLERPEYKRRWNWDDWQDLEQAALQSWLLDRLEAPELWPDTAATTTARLAGRLQADDEFIEVARLYAGDADLAEVIRRLVLDEAVPYLAAYRYKKKGLTKRKVWEDVWRLQRLEDAIDARTELLSDNPDHLSDEDAALRKKEQVGTVPVPPKYASGDFAKSTYWRLRGKLDVPKERFILYPDTSLGADTSPVVGWAGWDHLQQARALSGLYTQRKDAGAEPDELVPLLAGLHELVPWLLQWHNEPDPEFGQRLGEFFESFVHSEARALGTTTEDLATWRPS